MFKTGDRVRFYDPAGRVVSDIVTGHASKIGARRPYVEEDEIVPALLLKEYGWVPECCVLTEA